MLFLLFFSVQLQAQLGPGSISFLGGSLVLVAMVTPGTLREQKASLLTKFSPPPKKNKKIRRRANWNTASVQMHVVAHQLQPEIAVTVPKSIHPSLHQPLAEQVDPMRQPPWLESVSLSVKRNI